VALILLAAPGGHARRIETYGRGSNQVWLLRPDGPVQSVVVFGHGWKTSAPSALSWVDQFRPWLDHLLARGSAVIFPRYQRGTSDWANVTRVKAYRRGLVLAFSHLGEKRVPVVAAGYSFGASLAFYYAANAHAWGLPEPAAVDAVFPAGMIDGAPLPPIRRSMEVLIQVGDQDFEAGTAGGSAFWRWLGSHSIGRAYQTVHSTSTLTATHDAPKRTNATAQRVFWRPLDELVAQSRGPRLLRSVLLWLFAPVLEALRL
jgi:pimeloyl-ACP methyl ester carboxylesterase